MEKKMTIIRYDVDSEHIIRNITNVAITRGWNFIHYHKGTKDYMIVLDMTLNDVKGDVYSSCDYIDFSEETIHQMLTYICHKANDSRGNIILNFSETITTDLI